MSATANAMPQAKPETTARVPELDGIRGLAILLVVMLHYVSDTSSGSMKFVEPIQWCFNLGWSGVDLFFVLSGFLIGGILLDVRESPVYFRTFYMRRLFRIMPLYYLWMIAFVAMVFFHWPPLPKPLTLAHERLEFLPFYFLFLQNYVWAFHSIFGDFWLGTLWSLGIEEQFYLVAPAVIRLFSRATLVRLLVGTVALGPLIRLIVYKYISHSHGGVYVLTPCRADALALGMLIAVGWRSEKFRSWISLNRGYLLLAFWILFAGVIALNEFFFGRLDFVTAIGGYSWLAFFYGSMLLVVLSNRKGTLAWIMRRKFLMELGRCPTAFTSSTTP